MAGNRMDRAAFGSLLFSTRIARQTVTCDLRNNAMRVEMNQFCIVD